MKHLRRDRTENSEANAHYAMFARLKRSANSLRMEGGGVGGGKRWKINAERSALPAEREIMVRRASSELSAKNGCIIQLR